LRNIFEWRQFQRNDKPIRAFTPNYNEAILGAAGIGWKSSKGRDRFFHLSKECSVDGDPHAFLGRLSAAILAWGTDFECVGNLAFWRIRRDDLFFFYADAQGISFIVLNLLFPNGLLFLRATYGQ